MDVKKGRPCWAAFLIKLESGGLLRLAVLLLLVHEYQHEHVVGEPEYCSDWDGGEARLKLSDHRIR